MMNPYLQVALGGAMGATARYGVNRWAMASFGPGFPWATLIVNVAGSFAMGALVVVLSRLGNAWAPLLMTGVLGGFTTFSAFSLDTLTLWQRGEHTAATFYVAASVGLSLLAIVAGLTFARVLA